MNQATGEVSAITDRSLHSGVQGLYRYTMLQSKGDWFPGTFATEEALAKVDVCKAPAGMDVVAKIGRQRTRPFLGCSTHLRSEMAPLRSHRMGIGIQSRLRPGTFWNRFPEVP